MTEDELNNEQAKWRNLRKGAIEITLLFFLILILLVVGDLIGGGKNPYQLPRHGKDIWDEFSTYIYLSFGLAIVSKWVISKIKR